VGADGIRVGRRVWVARENDRVYGRVASLTPAIFGESSPGFVVLLDGETTVVTCAEERQGEQWDFADEREA
jgi:hypothetical protein